MKKVLLVVSGQGFQPEEYRVTKSELEAGGLQVITASDDSEKAFDHDGKSVTVDVQVENVQPREYDAIYLIGGNGALDHLDTPQVHKLLNEFFTLGKPYGAICISPRILAQAGLLQGKKATCWNGDEKAKIILEGYGAMFVDEHLVLDDHVITANGPEAAMDFGKAIVGSLQES